MKKVRYALGAVGAVPAIGLMAPVTTAAVNAPAQKTTAKTVSLRHSSASPAATGCTGSTKATASIHSVKLEFWHTFHPGIRHLMHRHRGNGLLHTPVQLFLRSCQDLRAQA